MKTTGEKKSCERAAELISVLYGEAEEREAIDFQRHLQVCDTCRAEMVSFGRLRESIDVWKFEALSGFTNPQIAVSNQFQRSKSAFAAFREFFNLSPLWLKGATALASLLFVVFAVLLFVKSDNTQPLITSGNPDAKYTEKEKDVLVQKALDEQKAQLLATVQTKNEEAKPEPVPERQRRSDSNVNQVTRSRRPLSRWERQQLAADLRLLPSDDDDGLDLLSDRIND